MWPVTSHYHMNDMKRSPNYHQLPKITFFVPNQIKSISISQTTTESGDSACVDTGLQPDTMIEAIV